MAIDNSARDHQQRLATSRPLWLPCGLFDLVRALGGRENLDRALENDRPKLTMLYYE